MKYLYKTEIIKPSDNLMSYLFEVFFWEKMYSQKWFIVVGNNK